MDVMLWHGVNICLPSASALSVGLQRPYHMHSSKRTCCGGADVELEPSICAFSRSAALLGFSSIAGVDTTRREVIIASIAAMERSRIDAASDLQPPLVSRAERVAEAHRALQKRLQEIRRKPAALQSPAAAAPTHRACSADASLAPPSCCAAACTERSAAAKRAAATATCSRAECVPTVCKGLHRCGHPLNCGWECSPASSLPDGAS